MMGQIHNWSVNVLFPCNCATLHQLTFKYVIINLCRHMAYEFMFHIILEFWCSLITECYLKNSPNWMSRVQVFPLALKTSCGYIFHSCMAKLTALSRQLAQLCPASLPCKSLRPSYQQSVGAVGSSSPLRGWSLMDQASVEKFCFPLTVRGCLAVCF